MEVVSRSCPGSRRRSTAGGSCNSLQPEDLELVVHCRPTLGRVRGAEVSALARGRRNSCPFPGRAAHSRLGRGQKRQQPLPLGRALSCGPRCH